MTATKEEAALAAALDQIDMAFGSKPQSPEFLARQASHRLERLLPIRERMAALAAADEAKHRDERGWTQVDPLAAYVIAWFLRKEADSDIALAAGNAAMVALEDAADHVEDGEILACPQEMLAELDEMIVELRAQAAPPLNLGHSIGVRKD